MQPLWNPFGGVVRAYLAADGIKLRHQPGFPWRRRGEWHVRSHQATDGRSWDAAVRGLADILHTAGFKGCSVDLIISSEFVRVMVVPASQRRLTASERDRLVQGIFARAYGDAAAGWEMRYCATTGPELLAAAVDRQFVGALAGTVRAGGCRLRSIQPLAVDSLERFRGRIPRGEAWVVVAESRTAAIALMERKRLRHMRIRPMADRGTESLAMMLDRESRLLDRPIRQVVVIGEGELSDAVARDWMITRVPLPAVAVPLAGLPAASMAGG